MVCVMTDELYHHGIKGQKWGIRRWQNADGTFNEAGKKRYFGDSARKKSTSDKTKSEKSNAAQARKGLTDNQKKALKVGAAVVGTALMAYGAYKIGDAALDQNYKKQMEAALNYVLNLEKSYQSDNRAAAIAGDMDFVERNHQKAKDIAENAYDYLGKNRARKFDPDKLGGQLNRWNW